MNKTLLVFYAIFMVLSFALNMYFVMKYRKKLKDEKNTENRKLPFHLRIMFVIIGVIHLVFVVILVSKI